MLGFIWLLAATFASTPQAAAIAAVSHGVAASSVSVVRANVVGRYALVLTRGGMMEGSAVHAPILVERFSFGWQPLLLFNESPCEGGDRTLDPKAYAGLFAGMEVLSDTSICLEDSGPANDVAAVREKMRGPLVPAVNVVDGWALGNWYGGGGGQTLFRKRDGRWTFVTGGGGAMGSSDIRPYGVPAADLCPLHVYDACDARRTVK